MGYIIGSGVNRTIFSAYYAPTTFGFHATQGSYHSGSKPAQPGAVRYLIKSIFCSDGANFYRFKKHVVSGISAHNVD
jgi:hypothetical protein